MDCSPSFSQDDLRTPSRSLICFAPLPFFSDAVPPVFARRLGPDYRGLLYGWMGLTFRTPKWLVSQPSGQAFTGTPDSLMPIFMQRRAFRIFPAYFCRPCAISDAGSAFREAPSMEPWWKFTFTMNPASTMGVPARSLTRGRCAEPFYWLFPLLAVSSPSACTLEIHRPCAGVVGELRPHGGFWLHGNGNRPVHESQLVCRRHLSSNGSRLTALVRRRVGRLEGLSSAGMARK